jgi:hypothetical protein
MHIRRNCFVGSTFSVLDWFAETLRTLFFEEWQRILYLICRTNEDLVNAEQTVSASCPGSSVRCDRQQYNIEEAKVCTRSKLGYSCTWSEFHGGEGVVEPFLLLQSYCTPAC